jgi:hypothetical protein
MRIASLSENLHAVEITAKLLNDPPSPGYTYVLPVPGVGLSSLSGNKDEMDLFRGFLGKLVEEWMRKEDHARKCSGACEWHGTR